MCGALAGCESPGESRELDQAVDALATTAPLASHAVLHVAISADALAC